MAFNNIRSVILIGLHRKSFLKPSPITAIQAATLVRDIKAKLAEDDVKTFEPWPYKKRKYNAFYEMLDGTVKRLTENSKLISIEGNIGTGKKEFAQKIASSFDLKYHPDVHFNESVKTGHFDQTDDEKIDGRIFNDMLNEENKFYGLEEFYSKENPNKLGNVSRSQLNQYYLRFHNYCDALVHLLNTGQGVVMPRSAYSDFAFVRAMSKTGNITPYAAEYYMDMMRKQTICDLLRPHVIIYLDAPVSHVQKKIKERNDPVEVNSKILSREYLQAIEDSYKQELLPEMEKYTEIINIDVTKPIDYDEVIYNLENLDLDPANYEETHRKDKFTDWDLSNDWKWGMVRGEFSDMNWRHQYFLRLDQAWHELQDTVSRHIDMKKVYEEGPGEKYAKGCNPDTDGHLKVLFKL